MRQDKSPRKCYGRKHESLAYNWLLGRAMVLCSLITVSGRLIVLGMVGQGPAVLAFFLTSILSSFVSSLSPRTPLDLTIMLSTGPLTRL